MSIKQTVQHNFSRHARRYDAHAGVQKKIGDHLIQRLGGHPFARVLDIGCGTGRYTCLLHGRYPAARITGIDLSAAMIGEAKRRPQAREIEFVVGDAETAEFDAPFDLITSNVCFHWFADLNGAVAKCAASLTADGLLAFSSLGPRTFWELGECLDRVLPAGPSINARTFVGRAALETALRRYFPSVSVVEETIVEVYPSLLQLLSVIKYTGARGAGLEGMAMTKTLLSDLERTCSERIGSVSTTYQVFYCLACKKEVEHP